MYVPEERLRRWSATGHAASPSQRDFDWKAACNSENVGTVTNRMTITAEDPEQTPDFLLLNIFYKKEKCDIL